LDDSSSLDHTVKKGGCWGLWTRTSFLNRRGKMPLTSKQERILIEIGRRFLYLENRRLQKMRRKVITTEDRQELEEEIDDVQNMLYDLERK
jgi:hypothetical protein